MRPVLTKQDFVLRYEAGEFGNHSPTWLTLEDFKKAHPVGRFHIRNRVANGATWYNILEFNVERRWYELLAGSHGTLVAKASDLYISAMAPHWHNLLQGEVLERENGLWLYYSPVVGKPMRDALAQESYQVNGLRAKMLLDWALNSRSREWMDYLLEEYPEHVIEFSAFSRCWGTVPRHNTVIWEIRRY